MYQTLCFFWIYLLISDMRHRLFLFGYIFHTMYYNCSYLILFLLLSLYLSIFLSHYRCEGQAACIKFIYNLYFDTHMHSYTLIKLLVLGLSNYLTWCKLLFLFASRYIFPLRDSVHFSLSKNNSYPFCVVLLTYMRFDSNSGTYNTAFSLILFTPISDVFVINIVSPVLCEFSSFFFFFCF